MPKVIKINFIQKFECATVMTRDNNRMLFWICQRLSFDKFTIFGVRICSRSCNNNTEVLSSSVSNELSLSIFCSCIFCSYFLIREVAFKAI